MDSDFAFKVFGGEGIARRGTKKLLWVEYSTFKLKALRETDIRTGKNKLGQFGKGLGWPIT